MEFDQRVANLEEEFKLIKGELKQTLASVREYLMETGLPDSEYSTILAALGGGADRQQVSLKGELNTPEKPKNQEEVEELVDGEADDDELASDEGEGEEVTEEGEEGEEGESGEGAETGEEVTDETEEGGNTEEGEVSEDVVGEGGEMLDHDETQEESDEELSREGDMAEQLTEPQAEYAKAVADARLGTPRVNLMANLIRWVANAKREIGTDQLASFLEVYGLCGHLTPELKDVILHLAEVAQAQSAEAGAADIWSRSLLELHGILTGADAPAHPARPVWSGKNMAGLPDEADLKAAIAETNKEEPVKLKLVLSDSAGKEREFSLNLNPAKVAAKR